MCQVTQLVTPEEIRHALMLREERKVNKKTALIQLNNRTYQAGRELAGKEAEVLWEADRDNPSIEVWEGFSDFSKQRPQTFGKIPVWNQTGSTPEPTWYTDAQITSTSQEPAQPSFAPELKSLLEVITKQAEKLEAASMRIGYLEARTENYEREIKLLTDSQHKRGWWARFGAWFLGQK